MAAGGPQQGHGSNPNAVYKGPDPVLSPEQQAALQQKLDKYAEWLANQQAGKVTSGAVQPYCLIGPSGQCINYYQVAGGGEYIQEPYDEPNWCAPGAATAVYMHWNYNAVVNHGSETVPRDYHTGGGTATYSGGQGWMAWFAVHIGFTTYGGTFRNGVMDQPYYNGANEYVVAAALDTLTSNYYHIVTTTSTSDMVGKTKYDITVDGRPLDFFVNAQFLPNWHDVGGQLNHSIEVYALGQSVPANYTVDPIYYADSISGSDSRATAGDAWDYQDHMYTKVMKTSAAPGDITW